MRTGVRAGKFTAAWSHTTPGGGASGAVPRCRALGPGGSAPDPRGPSHAREGRPPRSAVSAAARTTAPRVTTKEGPGAFLPLVSLDGLEWQRSRPVGPSMAVAYSDIARVLDGARRRQGLIVLATALGWGLAGVLLALLLGVGLLGAGAFPAANVRQTTLALVAMAAVVALAWAAVALMRRASTPLTVARTLSRAAPELRSDLLSSVELESDYEDIRASGRYSVALVDAHVARTAERAL